MENRCAALNKSGGRCKAEAVEETGWWRCERHIDWYDYCTKEEREQLAWLEIEDCIRDLDKQEARLARAKDLDTRRSAPR